MTNNTINPGLMDVLQAQKRGQSWEAMKKLKELTHADPDNAFLHKFLGNMYFHMGLLDWAIDYYNRAIELDNDFIDVHYDLGVAYYHRGRMKNAIAAFENTLKLDSEYHAAHYRLGICYQHVGDLEKAVHHFMESTVVTPEYVMAHYHLGEIFFETGELDKARAAIERVLEEEPGDEACLKLLAKIQQ